MNNWTAKITPNKLTKKIDIEVRNVYTKEVLKDSSLNLPICMEQEFKIRLIIQNLRSKLENNSN